MEKDFYFWYDNKKKRSYYFEETYQKVLEEHDKFIHGHLPISTDIVPSYILDSWIRSRDNNVNPNVKPNHDILKGAKLEELLRQNHTFIDSSIIFMEYLYQFIKKSRYSVTLFDRDGFILKVINTDEDQLSFRRTNWFVGASWSEEKIGTNGIGTMLKNKSPLIMFGPQHFVKLYHRFICYSVPIYNPQKKLLGGIAVTCPFYWEANQHTLGMTVASAKAIENELRSRESIRETKIANVYQKAVMESIPEAFIAIDNENKITLINKNAENMLFTRPIQANGKHLYDVIPKTNINFWKLIEKNDIIVDAEVRIVSNKLSSDYILTCNPIYSPSIGIIGKILVLNEIKRAKTLVTKMVGAKANFEFGNIIGKNKKFLKAVQQAQIASNSNSNILLLGESGTGKDVFAQAIHNASERAKKPFVAINCAAIPRDLIASELFGYEEGAFTGSVRGGKNGKFELADGGTIFLDEIAEIPLETQAVLLRVLEDKTISRLGSSFVRSVNVRIIAATNKNLHDEVQKRRFREDLYYRLNILSIHLVPLRERSDDIPLLLDHFLKNFRSIIGKKIVKIDPRVFEFLYSYNWPGNIREFQNVVERMVHYARGNELTIDLIPEEILYYVKADNRKDTPTFEATISTLEAKRDLTSSFNNIRLLHEQKERDFIIKMLNLDVKKKVLALEMGISRTTLYRMIKRYKISD